MKCSQRLPDPVDALIGSKITLKLSTTFTLAALSWPQLLSARHFWARVARPARLKEEVFPFSFGTARCSSSGESVQCNHDVRPVQ